MDKPLTGIGFIFSGMAGSFGQSPISKGNYVPQG